MGGEPVSIWHGDTDLKGADAVILPGGFSYGDYLRTGAIARFARVMEAVRQHADDGGPVLGICNGFQILCEAGLLPGALVRNRSLSFVCRQVHVRVETDRTPFTRHASVGTVLDVPVKHGEASSWPTPRRSLASRTRTRWCSGTARSRVRQARSGTRTAPPTTSPAWPTAGGTSSASCRTPSTPSTPTPDPQGDGRCSSPSSTCWCPRPRDRGATSPSARAHRRRASADHRDARPRAHPRRARHVRGDVVRALLVQVLEGAPPGHADRGSAHPGRARRGRRRRGYRGRSGVRVQDGVALASLGDRAVP